MHSYVRLAVFLAASGLAACSANSTALTSPSAIDGSSTSLETSAATTWTLRNFANASGAPVAIPADAVFTIAVADDRIAVKSDCNRCAGAATVTGNVLEVGALACTRAACQSMPVDSLFETTLSGTHTAVVNGSQLTLSSPRGVLVFTK